MPAEGHAALHGPGIEGIEVVCVVTLSHGPVDIDSESLVGRDEVKLAVPPQELRLEVAGEVQLWLESDRHQHLARDGVVISMDEDVEVRELSHREVAICRRGEHGTLDRQHGNALPPEGGVLGWQLGYQVQVPRPSPREARGQLSPHIRGEVGGELAE